MGREGNGRVMGWGAGGGGREWDGEGGEWESDGMGREGNGMLGVKGV
jgi:hypothetical protein